LDVGTSCTNKSEKPFYRARGVAGARVGIRKARALPPLGNHCTGLPLSVFHRVSFAWPLDMIRINPSNPVYVYTSRAMIVRVPATCYACSLTVGPRSRGLYPDQKFCWNFKILTVLCGLWKYCSVRRNRVLKYHIVSKQLF